MEQIDMSKEYSEESAGIVGMSVNEMERFREETC